MKIAIVGAGALGGYVGGHLSKFGRDVTLIDPWPEHVEAMRNEGLTLGGLTEPENFTVKVNALHLTELQQVAKSAPFDVAFVSTKSYDTVWATTMIQQYLAPDAFVVSLQNSINEERIAGVVGWGKTVGCIASTIAVELFAPGKINRNVQLGGDRYTTFRVGEVHGNTTPRVERIAEMLREVDSVRVTNNLWGERWTKLVINSMRNPVAASPARGGNANDRDELTRRLAIRLAGESIKGGLAHGYELENVYKMAPEQVMAARYGDEAAMTECEAIMLEGTNFRNDEQRPSMGQDMMKGRRTEIDYITGLVVEKAQERGIDVPCNDAILEVVKRVERGEIEAGPELVAHI